MEEIASCTILLVDSEEKVFRAIARILRSLGAEMRWARSCDEARDLLEEQQVALCLVDTRAPAIEGNAILCEIASRYPATRRMVLTGYADLDSTVSAINDGRIHRYFTKPWVNEALKDAVAEELSLYLASIEESRREKDLNRKAAVSSKLIEESSMMLRHCKYRTALDIQKELTQFRSPGLLTLIERIAETSSQLARDLRLPEDEVMTIRTAAELHRIGLLALPQSLLSKSRDEMTPAERSQFEQYSAIGADAIKGVATSDPVATIIRAHRERFNGSGFPDHLVGDFIPLGARIIGLVTEFETLQQDIGCEPALESIIDRSGYEFEPTLVNRLAKLVRARECLAEVQ